jgi:hypothetical protein
MALNPVGTAVTAVTAVAAGAALDGDADEDAGAVDEADAVPALVADVAVVVAVDPPPPEHAVANNTTSAAISGTDRTIAR